MRRDEWPGLAEWFEARWAPWSEETDEAYIQELEPYRVPVVLRAGKDLVSSGERFLSPPLLVKACRRVAEVDRTWGERALPAPSGDEVSWGEAAKGLGVEGMGFMEYALRTTGGVADGSV